MTARPATLRGSVALLLVAAIVAAGCTTIPGTEFATYKDTFAEARCAGETVVLDDAVAVSQFEEIKAKRAAAKPVREKRGEPFNPNAVSRNLAAVDQVLVRMKAWDVVARYNDPLTALAEGKSAEELAAAVDGLSASLDAFPLKAIAASAGEVSAYLAPLRALALEAAKEHSRRQFIDAVGKGAPPRGAAPMSAEAKAHITSLAQDAKAQLGPVAAKDDELNAYREVLVAYPALLNQLEQSLRGLQMAAVRPRTGSSTSRTTSWST